MSKTLTISELTVLFWWYCMIIVSWEFNYPQMMMAMTIMTTMMIFRPFFDCTRGVIPDSAIKQICTHLKIIGGNIFDGSKWILKKIENNSFPKILMREFFLINHQFKPCYTTLCLHSFQDAVHHVVDSITFREDLPYQIVCVFFSIVPKGGRFKVMYQKN